MSDRVLEAVSGLERIAGSGHYGAIQNGAGVALALRTDVSLASVMMRKRQQDSLANRVHEAFGLSLPSSPMLVRRGPIAFAWAGPGHWLAMAEDTEGHAFEARLRTELSGCASISDQSDGRIILRVGGPKARDALAKGVPIDLHPRAFVPGQTAVTTVAYIGVHLWQVDSGPTYEFAVFRSLANAFWEWLVASSAEFGVTVVGDLTRPVATPTKRN